MTKEENKCSLCKRAESEDTKTDFLREGYYFKSRSEFERGTFRPRLNFVELPYLKAGFNHICNNRTNCRQRMAINAKKLRIKLQG